MNGGVVAQDGDPNTIMQYPADEFVASFMGTETILAGTVTASAGGVMTIAVDGGAVEAAGTAGPGAQVTICVNPENIVLSDGAPETSARNCSGAGWSGSYPWAYTGRCMSGADSCSWPMLPASRLKAWEYGRGKR